MSFSINPLVERSGVQCRGAHWIILDHSGSLLIKVEQSGAECSRVERSGAPCTGLKCSPVKPSGLQWWKGEDSLYSFFCHKIDLDDEESYQDFTPILLALASQTSISKVISLTRHLSALGF